LLLDKHFFAGQIGDDLFEFAAPAIARHPWPPIGQPAQHPPADTLRFFLQLPIEIA
jgi:hypothetical protein